MPFAAADLQELRSERRLLRDVLALARRCDGDAPAPLLDAALAGTGAVRPGVSVVCGRP